MSSTLTLMYDIPSYPSIPSVPYMLGQYDKPLLSTSRVNGYTYCEKHDELNILLNLSIAVFPFLIPKKK